MNTDDEKKDYEVNADGEFLEPFPLTSKKKKKRNPAVRFFTVPIRFGCWAVLIIFSAIGIITAVLLATHPVVIGPTPPTFISPDLLSCGLQVYDYTDDDKLAFGQSKVDNPNSVSIYLWPANSPDASLISSIITDPASIQISPDGKYAIYLRSTYSKDKIYITDLATKKETYITDGEAPSFSSDGKQISYAAYRYNRWHIGISKSDGSDENTILDIAAASGPFRWSPDGKRLVFSAIPSVGPQKSKLYVVNIDGTNLAQITDGAGSDVSPEWSPDGQTIAYVSNGLISFINPDGTNPKETKTQSKRVLWEPDSKHVVYSNFDSLSPDTIIEVDAASLQSKTIYHCH